MNNNFNQRFNIIRQWGSPNEATTIWGWKAYREKFLFADEPFNTLIPCLDYDNHFIFNVPWKPEHIGYPGYLCTCGGPAIVVGIKAYKNDASPMYKPATVRIAGISYSIVSPESGDGKVFACMFRNCLFDKETGDFLGRHADGSS